MSCRHELSAHRLDFGFLRSECSSLIGADEDDPGIKFRTGRVSSSCTSPESAILASFLEMFKCHGLYDRHML
jgi:hypothetical protein